ncbi:LOW QUALITY PROTEIN: nephrin-like [Macrobrachium nipponense]|uniref:LOW QUALITY PROTEIN: nephrin-like n=1 Tax=Macrobrachium nipponense TaxID=159736 RepID=UPI0030C85E08
MLTNVTVHDHKLYRCRVDYHKSNSRQAWVRLTVIVPPSGIKIIPQISPVVLGQRNDVICSATGGSPLAKVEWIQEGQIVDSTSTPNDERDASYNSLEVRATRKDLSESFTCRAYNNKYTPMLQATYRRNVTCGPLSVEIVPEEKPIVAGRMVKLICTVVGSHPPALVTWFQQGQQVTPLHTQVQERDNVTVSTLLLKVTRGHHGRQMICRADHPILPLSTLEDIYTLDVLYKPNVSLSLGRSLDFQTLREGNDIFFECHVDSNPPPYKVTWHHQNEELFHNVSAGVLVSESTLALQHVQRHRSGDYKCIASNVEGDSESNVVSINIKYSPRCAVSPSLRGVALFELTNITCEVDADPFNVSFKWTFHNSVRRDQSQVREYTQEGLKSTLSYTPMSERDYGTLLCFATNDVGPQKEPCSFTIISAGFPPEEVSNCTAGNITSHSAFINCLPGFDGGLPQKFLLQIWETKDDQLVLNMTSQTPTFKAKPLDPGNTYRAKVVSFNSRGRSKPSKFIIWTLKKAEMRKSLPSMVPPSPPMFIMGVVGGIIAVTGALVIAILCWVRKKMKHPTHRDILHAQVILKENNPDL